MGDIRQDYLYQQYNFAASSSHHDIFERMYGTQTLAYLCVRPIKKRQLRPVVMTRLGNIANIIKISNNEGTAMASLPQYEATGPCSTTLSQLQLLS
eukprot:scaffold26657_cov19-Prasinocladus_malaysianus.AAC.1